MNILLIYEKHIGGVNSIGKLIEKKMLSSSKINITSYYTSIIRIVIVALKNNFLIIIKMMINNNK